MTANALELGLVLACASSLAQAGDPEFSLSTGLEYSTGSYGGEDDIEEMYVPVTGFIYFDRVALSINVPYLSVRAPSGTSVTDPGGEPVLGSGEITTESGLGDVVVGQGGDERGIEPEIRERDSHIGLAAAEGRLKRRWLKKSFVPWRLQPKHYLAKCNEFRHCSYPLIDRAMAIASAANCVIVS